MGGRFQLDDFKTVEKIWDANFHNMDIRVLKKGHNSGTPRSCLHKKVSWTSKLHVMFISEIMCNTFQLDDVETVDKFWDTNFYKTTVWWLQFSYN